MKSVFVGRQSSLWRAYRLQGAFLLTVFGGVVEASAATAPPSLSLTCTAPVSVLEGGSANIACAATSAEHRSLTYSFASSVGTISAHGASATFSATGTAAAAATIVVTVRDDHGDTTTQRLTIAIRPREAGIAIGPGALGGNPARPALPQAPKDHEAHKDAPPPHAPSAGSATTPVTPTAAPPVAAPPSGNEDKAIVNWVNGLPFGHITDNIASFPSMRLGVPYTVTVTIGGSDVNVTAPVGAAAPTALKVSDHMDVELTSGGSPDDFTILPVDAAQNPRLIVSNASTTWSWTVTPQALGELKLDVAAYVLYGDQQQNRVSYETYNRSVEVKSVTLWGYLTDGLEYVLENPGASLKYMLPGGGGAAIIALLIAWWRKRKTSRNSKDDDKSDRKPE